MSTPDRSGILVALDNGDCIDHWPNPEESLCWRWEDGLLRVQSVDVRLGCEPVADYPGARVLHVARIPSREPKEPRPLCEEAGVTVELHDGTVRTYSPGSGWRIGLAVESGDLVVEQGRPGFPGTRSIGTHRLEDVLSAHAVLRPLQTPVGDEEGRDGFAPTETMTYTKDPLQEPPSEEPKTS